MMNNKQNANPSLRKCIKNPRVYIKCTKSKCEKYTNRDIKLELAHHKNKIQLHAKEQLKPKENNQENNHKLINKN